MGEARDRREKELMDKELAALSDCTVALKGLDEETRKRVLWYLNNRFASENSEICAAPRRAAGPD